MSVNTQSNRVRVFTTTENQTIPIQFPFREDTDLVVERNVSGVYEKLVLSSDYTVSGAGTDDGGTVSLLTVPAEVNIRVTRIIDVTQESEYQPNVRLSETQIERDFDKLVMICQQLMTEIQDGVVAPFKGGWDAGSNTPYLEQTPYEDGVYYIVNVSGETWGIEFRIGDILFAVDGEWVRVPSALSATVVEEIYARLDALDEAVDEIEAVLGDATELPVPNTLMERGDAGETGVKYIDLAPLSAEELPATQAGRVYFDAEKGVMVVGLDDESDVTLSPATTAEPGLMSSADKTKLDGIEAGAEVNAVTSVNGYIEIGRAHV